MKKLSQHELILKFVKEYGEITPARIGGKAWEGGFFGAESSKRCRELRAKGLLASERRGKFEVFYLPKTQGRLNI